MSFQLFDNGLTSRTRNFLYGGKVCSKDRTPLRGRLHLRHPHLFTDWVLLAGLPITHHKTNPNVGFNRLKPDNRFLAQISRSDMAVIVPALTETFIAQIKLNYLHFEAEIALHFEKTHRRLSFPA